uniref:Glutathione peroxidase n=1 Tax=Podarcis muralis TaxID=64176 RepID=A0A670I4V9_PODMU
MTKPAQRRLASKRLLLPSLQRTCHLEKALLGALKRAGGASGPRTWSAAAAASSMARSMAGASLSSLAGVLVRPLGGGEPVDLGSLLGTTSRDFTQFRELQQRFGPQGLTVLAFPCNQFGHQENATNEEILNSLKYVRPGNGYEPNFSVFEKCEVNGENAHPLFKFLKKDDIAWNFEKFLISRDGVPFKRYSRRFETIKIQDDIQKLL